MFRYCFFNLKNSKILYKISMRNAGHSKWQNIRHVKGEKDAQRSNLFMKIQRQMKVAIQENGSADPKSNLKLEHAIEQAKRANMPNATIQSFLKNSTIDKNNCKTHILDIKGPGGCIILFEVFTSNVQLTKQQISGILKKHQSRYSDRGGVYMFEEKGVVEATHPVTISIELATEHAIEASAEDVSFSETDESVLNFICAASALKTVTTALEALSYTIKSSSVEYIPLRLQKLTDDEKRVCGNLYNKLEALPEFVRLSDNIA